MLYKGRRQSDNVEDRRGMSRGMKVGGGVGIGAVIIGIITVLLGGDPGELLNTLQQQQPGSAETSTGYQPSAHEEELAEFAKVTFADTEDVWNEIFSNSGLQYREPTLVLYSNATQSACGFSSAATGPFYCPGDEKVYIDLNFLEQLQNRLGAQGDFAMAYIIAHEVGHHVQKLLGTMDKVQGQRNRISEESYNDLSVRLELQADFYAGVWAHHIQKKKHVLEDGDIEEAFNAAQAVGDDKIQMKTQGYVVPDSFTHGTSQQRSSWFRKGFSTGNPKDGNTFGENI